MCHALGRPSLEGGVTEQDHGSGPPDRQLRVQDIDVRLRVAPGVFIPSPNGLFYAGHLRVRPGERVIDIGTGSGILGIWAAKAGARVVVTDTDPRAVAAARANAVLNGVELDARVGSLFADATDRFDAILANLPNEIVAPAYLAELDPRDAATFAGGELGNAAIISLLATADRYMHERSRLYLPVHSLTDYHDTLRHALLHYGVRLIGVNALPVKPFVTAHLGYYRGLDAAGVITIFERDGQWYSWGYVYELALPERVSSTEPRLRE
jgi:methylase of polypeptide subunit release factors